MKTTIIGIDLGGTNMRAGRVVDGKIMQTESASVPKTDQWEVVLEKVIEITRAVWTNQVKGIGIGIPGIVDKKTGMVYDIQNIPSWIEVPVGQLLSDQFNVPVYVNNDANCFAAGERHFGKGRNFDDFVGLISGTGLGAGIIKDGHLLPDQNCGSGEFGMIPYLDSIYEYYCSGQFFSREAGISGKQTAIQAKEGDPVALELFKTYGKHLGNAIKTIIFALDPAAIILGGSVSKSFDFFKPGLLEEIQTFPYSKPKENLVIVTSEITDIAILGAAALYFDAEKNNNAPLYT